MKLLAKQNRELIMVNAQNTQNENDAEKIILKVPEQYEDFNKKIVFVTPDGNVWDIITNNEYLIKKAITKYKQVDFYIWLTKGNVDFRSQTKTLKFYHNVDASDEITDEEIGRVNTVVNLLEEEITKVENLESQIDGKLEEVDTAIDNIHTAIQETENLDLDAEKVGQTTTITLTKKDGTVKTVHVDDGVDLQFMWQGTSLGIKTAEQEQYTFVDLQGVQGQRGEQGEPFTIKKTYSSVAEMNADFNNMQLGDYVMIASTVEVEDNAKLYTRGESQWIFITDFSGATGIRGETGLTPNIQIGTVTQGSNFNVTRTGTNENPILNFTLVKGDKGDRGIQGIQGLTGNGIASITKTSTSGLVDTYTITYTNGNTTTFTVTNGENADEITNLKKENAYLQNVVKQAFTETSASGTELTINNTIEARMEMKLNGNTSQNGEPTPATPQDINVVTGDNTINVINKNLLKNQLKSGSLNGITYVVNDNGSITLNGTATNNVILWLTPDIWKYDASLIVLEPGTYTISFNNNIINGLTLYASYYNKNNENILGVSQEITTYKILTLTEEVSANYRIQINKDTTLNNVTIYPMIEKGSTKTDYISNKQKSFPINLGSLELCKIGDYQDYIYKKDNKWYKHKEIEKFIVVSTNISKGSKLDGKTIAYIFGILPNALTISSFYRNKGFCNISKDNLAGGMYGNKDSYGWNIENNVFNIRLNATDFPNVSTVKEYFKDKSVYFYYILATPTEEEITDTTLITQLDEISQALSQKGTTIISQSNDDLPFNLDVIALTK